MTNIQMEQESETVYDGKLLHEFSYNERNEKHSELMLNYELPNNITLAGKIDYYDRIKNVVHETKRSNKIEIAHEWQIKYYLWLLKLNNILDTKGILEYPTLRKTQTITLRGSNEEQLSEVISSIILLQTQKCPDTINKPICKNCSYYDLCYINES